MLTNIEKDIRDILIDYHKIDIDKIIGIGIYSIAIVLD